MRRAGEWTIRAEERTRARRFGTGDAVAPFGKVGDTPVQLYTLTNKNGLVAKITNYGAIVTELHVPDQHGTLADVVLGFDSLDGYAPAIRTSARSSGAWPIASGTPGSRWRASATRLRRTMSRTTCMAAEEGWDKVVWNVIAIDTAEGPALELTYVSRTGKKVIRGR